MNVTVEEHRVGEIDRVFLLRRVPASEPDMWWWSESGNCWEHGPFATREAAEADYHYLQGY